ncbi:histidine--tRNA ligase [Canibacter zhoujuaniae]|uniref:histidine--tRNA ligase n=1 Tax=Canibacter zhoujuaniae TaxID=2708343 RepID=UPI001420E185|nr:ATP phosphoribosyltransferase regulatory subunit [Canibacter zhoujuaniae]
MAQQVNPPRGMRDFLPAQKLKRERALAIIREVYAAHGFDEIEAPVIEDYARLHAGLGGDNEKLSFSILKRGLRQEQLENAVATGAGDVLCDLGLRFDLTVPLARYYASNRADLPATFRAVHIGPVWRAERPQKGRYRQFVQADIDIIGEPGLLAEAELITATSAALARLGLAGCVIRINDRRLLAALLDYCGFNAADSDRVLITIDKLDKIGVQGVIDELRGFGAEFVTPAVKLEHILNSYSEAACAGDIALTESGIAAVLPNDLAPEVTSALISLGEMVAPGLPAGVRLAFDPTLVRGMGYYTGTIFEIAHPGSGSSVGGGGRYDGMIGRFLSQSVPAVGFSIGFERIIDLIDLPPAADQRAVALIADKAVDPAVLLRIKAELIASGARVQIATRTKNVRPLLDRFELDGFTEFANVRPEHTSMHDLDFKVFAES